MTPYKSIFLKEDKESLPSDEEILAIDLSPVNKAVSDLVGINIELEVTKIASTPSSKYPSVEDPRNLAGKAGVFKAIFKNVKIQNLNTHVFGDGNKNQWWVGLFLYYETLDGKKTQTRMEISADYNFTTKKWNIKESDEF